MSPFLALAVFAAPSPPFPLPLFSSPSLQETKVTYTHVAGESATYEIKGSFPVNDGRTSGEIKGSVILRTLSVGEDGSAEAEFLEKDATVKAMGQTMELPETEPLRVKMDRQGYLLAEPVGGSFSGLATLMFGIPGEPMTVGRTAEWKVGGAFPAKPGEKATAKLREVKDGRATIEREITTKDGQRVRIVTTHELVSGRLTKGEINGKGQGGGDVKIALALKSVKKDDGER